MGKFQNSGKSIQGHFNISFYSTVHLYFPFYKQIYWIKTILLTPSSMLSTFNDLFWAHNKAEAIHFLEHFISIQSLAITLASCYSVTNDQMAKVAKIIKLL